jgi:tRNA (mo5U34)-methyltransferase
MEPRELQERISAFPRWHYRFEFEQGVATRPPDPGMANRHEQRRRYIFEPLLTLTGGSLRGRRVLDLGCNAGYWSLLAAEAHADFVLGVDAREVHIEQANLVFEAKGVDRSRYRFEHGNLFTHPIEGRYDVVLCLGLLDHVAKPVELFDVMARSGPELIVLDTEISRSKESVFDVASLHDPDSVVDHEMVLIPSRQAIYELAGEFGMAAVPLAPNMTDYTGMLDYERGRRLAFICSASIPLSGLAIERRPPLLPWWAGALLPRRRGRGS